MAVISAESFLENLPSILLVILLTAALAAFNEALALASLALIAFFSAGVVALRSAVLRAITFFWALICFFNAAFLSGFLVAASFC
jgi:hypothetical protein